MITRPLELQAKVAAPPRDFDVFFWLNAAAIGLFFALLGSKFVLAPGLPVGVGTEFVLPQTRGAVPGAAEVVVSYRRDNMILFEGGIYELAKFKTVLADYAKTHRGATMIVRVDRQVSMQGFIDLCDLARAAGFAAVHVAAEPGEEAAPQFVPTGTR
jgi:biopolymer transport protein ExbD